MTVPAVFLAISTASLIIQYAAAVRIVTYRAARTPQQSGLVRTSLCRVVAAIVYVAVGLLALADPTESGAPALIAFGVVQIMWWGNSIADFFVLRRLPTRGESDG